MGPVRLWFVQGQEKSQFALFGATPIDELLALDHPLRKIRTLFDEAWSSLSLRFEDVYGTGGKASYPPAVLLRAWLLMGLYSIRSERALCEQVQMNAGFRWFVGLDWDDKVFDHSTLSFNRERLFGGGAAQALLAEVCRLAEKRRLLQSDRLVVDGTLIRAWASHKSFQPKSGPPSDGGDFRGGKRSNQTHVSRTDPDARLLKKGGQESMLCHLGHALVDSVSGIVRACRVTPACGLEGDAEVVTAVHLAQEHMSSGQTLIADRGYDRSRFVNGLRELGITAHCRAKTVYSALDPEVPQQDSYKQSMKRRYKVESVFAWVKASGRKRQTLLRGTDKVDWEFHLYCTAFNLRRLASLR